MSGDSADRADSLMVGSMRLVLAATALLVTITEARALEDISLMTWVVLWGYFLHATLVICYARLREDFARSRRIHRLDVVWYAAICLATGGIQSPFFLFFFFAILTCSFRWGFDEGARITVASAALFVATGLATDTAQDITRLLLRVTFLLTLGYMSVYWGGSKMELRRRLALLREVSRVSNPRFGVDHTFHCLLENVRDFFQGQACVLVMRDGESSACTLRTAHPGETPHGRSAQTMDKLAATPFLALLGSYITSYECIGWKQHVLSRRMAVYSLSDNRWVNAGASSGCQLADLLEARAFISAPVHLRRSEGRIFVVGSQGRFRKSDALFLHHIVLQAFAVIENIQTIDRMASDAASMERQRLTRDLHDATVQPYIGLNMALSAIRNKAGPGNPVCEELERLISVGAGVIADVRRYAESPAQGHPASEQVLAGALSAQARRMKEFYGIDIAVQVQPGLLLNDRLAAEVLQLAREGMSNISRHTLAQSGSVHIAADRGLLAIAICNAAGVDAKPPAPFRPRSLTERAEALGGTARVDLSPDGSTAVRLEIPL